MGQGRPFLHFSPGQGRELCTYRENATIQGKDDHNIGNQCCALKLEIILPLYPEVGSLNEVLMEPHMGFEFEF